MTNLLKLLTGVPGWVPWGLVVFLGVVIAGQRAEVAYRVAEVAQAQRDTAKAREACAADKASGNALAAARVAAARASDAALISQQTEVIDALQTNLASAGRRADDLAGRLRQPARTFTPAGGGCLASGAPPAGGGDGQRGAGLPGLAGADLVVLDGPARLELAQLAVSAHDTGQTLKACRVLLRQAWQASQ